MTYTWTLPSGWSGSSTSNTINATTNIGGGGTISVTAKRTDGNGFVVRTYSMNIERPVAQLPTITGDISTSICSGVNRFFSATSTNATTFQWSKTGPISVIQGVNVPSNVVVSSTGNGSATLTVTANNACLVPQSKTINLFSGTPSITNNDVLVDGHPNYYPNYTSGSSYISIQNQSSCTGYIWELYGGSGYYYASYGCSACNNPSYNQCNSANASTSSSMALRVRTANNCGIGNDVIIPLQVSGGGGYYMMASPNPTKNIISVDLLGDLPYNKLKKMTLVSDARSSIVRSHDSNNSSRSEARQNGNTISFDVSNLPRGTYYLIMAFGENENKSFKETIILN